MNRLYQSINLFLYVCSQNECRKQPSPCWTVLHIGNTQPMTPSDSATSLQLCSLSVVLWYSTFSKLMSTKYWFVIHTAFAVYFHSTCIFHSFVGCSQHESSGRPNNLNTIHNMHVSAKSLIVSAFALNILFSHRSCIIHTFVGRLHHTRWVLSETIGVVDLLICRS